jgi:heat shock protein HspQ
MLNRVFGKNFHDHFHLFGICVLAIGLPTSKVILSLGMMLLVLNLLLHGSFSSYWKELKQNRFFHLLAIYWSLHLIGLLWTSDFAYASNDLRIKLTLLVIPLIFTVKPIRQHNQILLILLLFIATLCVTSLFNYASYQHWIGNKSYTDIRELSLFGSHIRYGILISIGAGICIYYLRSLHTSKKWLLLPVLFWFAYYTYYSQIISGLISFIVVILVFFIFLAFLRSRILGYSAVVVSSLILLTPLVFFFTAVQTADIDYVSLDSHTAKGNPYSHFLGEETFIDGKPVLAYVCEKELKEEWQKRSNLNYDSLDLKGQPLRFTLMRYMTSKNLKKDANGFKQLTNQDISHIEKGVASVEETKTGLTARLEGIKFQLHNSIDPNGHSLLQRIEYWKTGIKIIQQNWLFGVGTGDVQRAFDQQYKHDHSPLSSQNRLRAHNTYLTNWISFGIIGLLVFLWMIFYFLRTHIQARSFLPVMFMLVACSSFIIEDTLETQMGVTFFAFFYGLFIMKDPRPDRSYQDF